MPRRFLPFSNGYTYHIFNRGVNRYKIFNSDSDYSRFLSTIKFYLLKDPGLRFSKYLLLTKSQQQKYWQGSKFVKQVRMLCYTFMPNHFHFLLRQETDRGISKFMSQLQNSYTKYFNTKHKRTGHLLQGQFKAVGINSEAQLLHVSRYIHLNPLSSGLVPSFSTLRNYPWSSILEYLQDEDMCETETILSYFKNQDGYRKFMTNHADYKKNLEEVKHLTLE